MLNRLLKLVIPLSVRKVIIHKIRQSIRQFKAPKMVWGYLDSSGEWRSGTRISDTVFFCHPEKIFIDDNVFIGHYSILDGTGGLEIGEGSQIAGWNGIYTHSSHIAIRIYGRHYREVPEYQKKAYMLNPVKIGKYVFIGAGAKLFPGISIGDGALIKAGSVVSKSVNNFEIVSGNPAEVIGDTRKLDKRYLNDSQLLEWYQEWQNN